MKPYSCAICGNRFYSKFARNECNRSHQDPAVRWAIREQERRLQAWMASMRQTREAQIRNELEQVNDVDFS